MFSLAGAWLPCFKKDSLVFTAVKLSTFKFLPDPLEIYGLLTQNKCDTWKAGDSDSSPWPLPAHWVAAGKEHKLAGIIFNECGVGTRQVGHARWGLRLGSEARLGTMSKETKPSAGDQGLSGLWVAGFKTDTLKMWSQMSEFLKLKELGEAKNLKKGNVTQEQGHMD